MKTSLSLSAFLGLLAILVSLPARAEYPVISTVTVAGSGGGPDAANAIAQDASGNLYVAGSLTQAGGDDIWLAKYSPALVLLSSYTYDRAGFSDIAYGVGVDTASGGVFAVGDISSGPAPSSRDVWIGKFNSSLVLQSSVIVNGASNDDDQAHGLRVSGGSVYVVGLSSGAGSTVRWVARYDTNLVLIASSSFVSLSPFGWDILPVASGNVFACGSRAPNAATSNDTWIGKYDSNLVLLASATINGPSSNTDEFRRLADDGAGGVFAVGFLNTATAGDRFIQHYDSNLVRVSSSLVNGPGNADEYLSDVLVTSSGTLLVAGEQSEVAGLGGRNALIAEYTAGLALISSTSYTSSGSGVDHASAFLLGANKDLYVAGWVTGATSDAWIARFSTAAISAPAAPSAFAGAAQSTSSILWSWTDNSTDETGFRINFGGTNVSGNLAANTTTWLQTGLGVNTSSGSLLVQAFNSTGTADSGSLTRYSLAATPTALAASSVFKTSATVTWTAGNPAGTLFELERSTGTGFGLAYSSITASYTDASLAAGTTYYFRARAFNADSVASAYSSTISVVTGVFPGPNAPSAFAGTAQSTASILWSWTDNSLDEAGFRIMAGAANVSGDLAANATTWLQTGLGINTSSGSLLVQSFNSTGTANSGSLTRYSLAVPPSGLASSSVFQTSATLTWTSGNPGGTIFELERSTAMIFTLIASSAITSYTNTGISAGSTYYYRVRALNGDSAATLYASSITVPTLLGTGPAAPSAFIGTAQSTTTILWTWSDNSSDETGFRVKFGGSNVSGDLAANATTWLQTGLGVNTSSGSLFVQAFNSTGTANSGSVTRYTSAADPSGLASSSVFQTSATVTWTANNPAGTLFELERSTGLGFALAYSSVTASFTDTGLSPVSTYYYRVRAVNADALATAYTSSITFTTFPPPVPGAPTGFAGAAQTATSILWSWTDAASNETGYRVMSGAVNVSGDLAADATAWLQTGLGVNTVLGPYFAQAFNVAGTADSGSASRTTLAAAPSVLAVAGVALTSATVSWNSGGNPAGTTFQLERSTGTGYGLQFAGAATYYFDGYLTAGATHYFRVRALNGEAVATAYASTLAVVALPAPPPPLAAGTPAGTALGTSSVTWTWVLASGATTHYLFRPSDNSLLGATTAPSFVQTALTPNTAYGLRAAGFNVGGTGPLSPSGTVYTLAAFPAGAAAVSIASTSLTASWGLAGNPASTVAQFERSTSGVVYTALASGAFASYPDADLLGCTTYYYRVRNVNGDGLLTAYASFQGVTANTIPSPPSGLSASANSGGTIGLSWGASPTEGVSGYRLYWDAGTGTVSYAAPIAVLASTDTAFTTGVLASSASYTFALRAVHRCGSIETTGATAMSGAATSPPEVRAVIKEPDSGRRINGNRVTILGELVAGTPGDVEQVLFQYKLATSTAWLDVAEAEINHSNPDFSFPYFVHADVAVLAPGSYDLRAVAYDAAGVPDPAPPAVRVVVDPVTPDMSEGTTVDGKIKKDQTISNTVTSVVDTAGAGAADPAVRVTIPPGVVNSATATVSVIANPTITTAAPTGQTMVGSAIKIDLSNGQSALTGTAAITLTYPETVLFPSLLQIYYLNEATGQWSRDFNSTVNTASHTVTGLTPHFSTFAIMLGTAFAPDLSNVRVYPVPYKPNGSNPDEGRPFSAGDANSGIIFANMASGSEIRIYTLTGRLVASLDSPAPTGTVRWDARNQDGRDVASGAYFAVISAAGQKNVVKKLVIIR